MDFSNYSKPTWHVLKRNYPPMHPNSRISAGIYRTRHVPKTVQLERHAERMREQNATNIRRRERMREACERQRRDRGPEPTVKTCADCKQSKPVEEFYRRRRGGGNLGHYCYCKECYTLRYDLAPQVAAAIRSNEALRESWRQRRLQKATVNP